MILRTVKSEGLAHLSYLVGSGGEAAVIDPRLDSDVYVKIASGEGLKITRVFETHRNEDYVVGSRDLEARTGAAVHHGSRTAFGYGESVSGGDAFDLGDIRLSVLETPGHTPESISLVLYDRTFSDERPVAVFTGDALFVGDVGRTDFFPGREADMAGFLYDSIFEKLLPLGDGVAVFPGHGEGSVCGGKLAAREFSTLGYERMHNPALRHRGRKEFIAAKLAERHYLPPYFETVHRLNREGPPVLGELPLPPGLPAPGFAARAEGSFLLDVRSPEAFAGAHLPDSLVIPAEMIPEFAGWLLPYDRDILLVAEDGAQVERSARFLVRMGFLRVRASLAGGLGGWYTSGREYGHVEVIHVEELVRWIIEDEDFFLLDVRTAGEFAAEHLPGAANIFLGELPGSLEQVPRDKRVVTFCGSGRRAIIAASILKKNGYERVLNCFGSMRACGALGCPLEQA